MNGDQIENKPNMQEHNRRLPQSRDRRAHVRRASESLTYVALGQDNGGIVANISENGSLPRQPKCWSRKFCPASGSGCRTRRSASKRAPGLSGCLRQGSARASSL